MTGNELIVALLKMPPEFLKLDVGFATTTHVEVITQVLVSANETTKEYIVSQAEKPLYKEKLKTSCLVVA